MEESWQVQQRNQQEKMMEISDMESKINQITRYGAYGVVLKDSKLLLTLKKSGPYKGLWGLPGGAIEFSESPEEGFKRELTEETALKADQLELLSIATHNGEYKNNAAPYSFHHIGIIYKVTATTPIPHLVPEEKMRWILISELKQEELTPFAKQALSIIT